MELRDAMQHGEPAGSGFARGRLEQQVRALNAAQEQYEEQRKNDRAAINEQQRASIAALAHDFPRLWENPKTPDRARKRLVGFCLRT